MGDRLAPRGYVTQERLDWAEQRLGPTWVSCGYWVLSLCPFDCPGRRSCSGGRPWTFEDDPDPF